MISSIGLFLDILGFSMMLVFNPTMKMLDEHIKTAIKTGKSELVIPDDYSGRELFFLRAKFVFHKLGIVLVIIGFSFQLYGTNQ